MSKLDFTKVEESLTNAMHAMFVKKITEGKPSISKRLVRFYGVDSGPRPKPKDPVIETIDEMREETRLALLEAAQKEGEQEIALPPKKEPPEPPSPLPPPEEEETEEEELSPEKVNRRRFLMTLLRQHFQWFRKMRVRDLNTKLGSSGKEIDNLDKKETLTPEEAKRLEELVEKAHEVKIQTMKELGLETDEVVIEKQRKKHTTKRLNIRENWLPLD